MASNLIHSIVHSARRVVARTYAAARLVQGHYARKTEIAHREAVAGHKAAVSGYKAAAKAHQSQARLHQKSVKARVSGIQSAVRGVTKGNRAQRAQQLKGMRANPTQRRQLRRRVQYKTQMP